MQTARIEISDISADISAIYRISGLIETIFDTENRLQEKSRKIGEYRRYFGDISAKYRILTEISVEISMVGKHARVGIFLVFSGRYIGDISEISVKYRRYIGNIGKNIGDISRYIGIYRDISEIYPNDQI